MHRLVGLRRGLSSLSETLSQIASESRCRKELSEQVKALASVISRRDWDPNSRLRDGIGFRLTPDHVSELVRGLSAKEPEESRIWALRIYIWATRQPDYDHSEIVRSQVLEIWEHRNLVLPFLHALEHPSCLDSAEKFLLLIQGYGWARMPDMAMASLSRMTSAGFDPDVSHFNSLLYALVQCNRLRSMREVFKHMLERGVSPNASTYALRVRGYCVAGQFDEAHKAFRQMLKAGFRPDLKTFGCLIDSMCKANRARLLYVIVHDLHEHRCSPDVSIYHEILEGLCRNDCVKDAEKLVKLIRERGIEPGPYVCNVLVKGQCREGKVQNALIQVHDMLKRGFLPYPDVFDALLINLFKQGRIGNICKLLDKLLDKGFAPELSSYSILIYGLSKCEEVDKAFEAWNLFARFSLPSVKAYRALIEQLCQSGRVAEAKLVFKTTMEKGSAGDDAAHDILIQRLKQAGRVNDASECQEILRERRKQSCNSKIFENSDIHWITDDSDVDGYLSEKS